jgi:hypothetical protein
MDNEIIFDIHSLCNGLIIHFELKLKLGYCFHQIKLK